MQTDRNRVLTHGWNVWRFSCALKHRVFYSASSRRTTRRLLQSLRNIKSYSAGIRVRVHIIGHLQPCITEIYLHIVARMADYMEAHPYPVTARTGINYDSFMILVIYSCVSGTERESRLHNML